jgi:hypothetical protein
MMILNYDAQGTEASKKPPLLPHLRLLSGAFEFFSTLPVNSVRLSFSPRPSPTQEKPRMFCPVPSYASV